MPDRAPLGLSALALAAVVIVAAPVAFRVAALWDGALTWAVLLLGFGTVLVSSLAWAWAYRHRPVVDAETVKTLGRVVDVQYKALERERRLLPAEPARWPAMEPEWIDVTAAGRAGEE